MFLAFVLQTRYNWLIDLFTDSIKILNTSSRTLTGNKRTIPLFNDFLFSGNKNPWCSVECRKYCKFLANKLLKERTRAFRILLDSAVLPSKWSPLLRNPELFKGLCYLTWPPCCDLYDWFVLGQFDSENWPVNIT